MRGNDWKIFVVVFVFYQQMYERTNAKMKIQASQLTDKYSKWQKEKETNKARLAHVLRAHMHTHTCIQTHTHTHTHTHTDTRIQTHAYRQTHTHTHAHTD